MILNKQDENYPKTRHWSDTDNIYHNESCKVLYSKPLIYMRKNNRCVDPHFTTQYPICIQVEILYTDSTKGFSNMVKYVGWSSATFNVKEVYE